MGTGHITYRKPLIQKSWKNQWKQDKDMMDQIDNIVEILKILICLPFLLYSCYLDVKTRRVTNTLWPKMLGAASILILYDLYRSGIGYLGMTVLSAVIIFIFVYLLFRLNLFGGADAKILIIIAIIIPVYPVFSTFGLQLPLWGLPPIPFFAYTVFSNSVVLTIIVPLGMAAYNLLHTPIREILEKPSYIFIGYKSPISKLKGHIKLMEEFNVKRNSVMFRFRRSGVKIDNDVIKQLTKAYKKELIGDTVWVTPGIPFMIPITAGFITAVIYGDIIFYLTSHIIS